MEKITGSSSAISEKQQRFAATVGRFIVMALLISAVVSVALPGPMLARAELQVGLQASYRSSTFSAGTRPSAAKIGDLDGDGLNDIAVVNLQGSLQLFFNNGAGSFVRTSLTGLWPATSNMRDIDIGDLNGDGRKDIAVAFSTQTGAVSVLFNQGGRTFTAPVTYNLCNSSRGVAIGDLDQDGDSDLADISQCSRSGILLNNGQGGFTFNGTYGNGSASRSVALADFNRDGFKDIAYVNNGLANITVMFNNRNATFGAPRWEYAGDLPDDLAVGDFDGEGSTDIAIANSYLSQIIILFNNGGGSFTGYSEIDGADTPTNIASGDLNGDGRTDFAVTSWGTNRLSVFTNRGDYTFDGPATFNVGQSPVDVAAGRLDGDSLPDLVAVNEGSGSITVLFTSAGGSAPPPPPQITLTVSTQSSRRSRTVDLRWSNATTANVDIYRNGSLVDTVSNTGSYTDFFNVRSNGTYTYKVCGAGGQVCSNPATISF